jgi:endonuclease YncB( thermonuclease family)
MPLRPDFSSRSFDVLDVLEVHDGDTYKLLLDTGFEVAAYPWLRLKDFSCPELKDEGGPEAQKAAQRLLGSFLETVWVVTYKIPPSLIAKQQKKYGDSKRTFARYIASVYLGSGISLGEELVKLGLARPGAFVG